MGRWHQSTPSSPGTLREQGSPGRKSRWDGAMGSGPEVRALSWWDLSICGRSPGCPPNQERRRDAAISDLPPSSLPQDSGLGHFLGASWGRLLKRKPSGVGDIPAISASGEGISAMREKLGWRSKDPTASALLTGPHAALLCRRPPQGADR